LLLSAPEILRKGVKAKADDNIAFPIKHYNATLQGHDQGVCYSITYTKFRRRELYHFTMIIHMKRKNSQIDVSQLWKMQMIAMMVISSWKMIKMNPEGKKEEDKSVTSVCCCLLNH
jgi:hypothetical protein